MTHADDYFERGRNHLITQKTPYEMIVYLNYDGPVFIMEEKEE